MNWRYVKAIKTDLSYDADITWYIRLCENPIRANAFYINDRTGMLYGYNGGNYSIDNDNYLILFGNLVFNPKEWQITSTEEYLRVLGIL